MIELIIISSKRQTNVCSISFQWPGVIIIGFFKKPQTRSSLGTLDLVNELKTLVVSIEWIPIIYTTRNPTSLGWIPRKFIARLNSIIYISRVNSEIFHSSWPYDLMKIRGIHPSYEICCSSPWLWKLTEVTLVMKMFGIQARYQLWTFFASFLDKK